MKAKIIAAVAAIALIVGFSAINVSAWGGGNGGHMMGSGMMYGAGVNDAERQKFFTETKDIRIQIAVDRAELNALMIGQNPDSKRVRELSESIALNQIALQEKAQNYDFGNGRMNGRRMMGPGMMKGGYGPCMQ
jgi:Spy/CpxP family protein refolding chaperone